MAESNETRGTISRNFPIKIPLERAATKRFFTRVSRVDDS